MQLDLVKVEPHVCTSFRPVLSHYGDRIGEQCTECLAVEPTCLVCRRLFKKLPMHLDRSYCGYWDRKGMWWTPNRPPGGAYAEDNR